MDLADLYYNQVPVDHFHCNPKNRAETCRQNEFELFSLHFFTVFDPARSDVPNVQKAHPTTYPG